jgi:hypothetical protein
MTAAYTRKLKPVIAYTHYDDLALAIYNEVKRKPGTFYGIAMRLNVLDIRVYTTLANMTKRGLLLCEDDSGVLSVMEAVCN